MDEPSLLNASKELPPAELALGLRAPDRDLNLRPAVKLRRTWMEEKLKFNESFLVLLKPSHPEDKFCLGFQSAPPQKGQQAQAR